jgi:hypothetical protein
MRDLMNLPWTMYKNTVHWQHRSARRVLRFWESFFLGAKSNVYYLNGLASYTTEFMAPYWTALHSFLSLEREKITTHEPKDTLRDYAELFQFNLQIARTGYWSSLLAINDYCAREYEKALLALINTVFDREGQDFKDTRERRLRLIEMVNREYPKAIDSIEAEFGFHFDDGGYLKVAETERFDLYQVLPLDKDVAVKKDGKPLLIIPPYVLGPGILAFLPGENKSYVHCYANQGIPTYIRILKDIDTTPAVQVMAAEDDCLDTKYFCERIKERHGRHVTLNGFCQGGFVAVLALLSGELDGLVDAFITCVAPMDGTRSRALVSYLEHIPPRFRDLGYAAKTLPNGNRVVDGKVMSWVYKLKSMEREAPVFAFHRDLMMFDQPGDGEVKINKTAAALNYWLMYERKDLPVGITDLSFKSYTIPVTPDGTLPVKLFGRELNFKRLKEIGIPWLICIAEDDDLVDRDAALAPLDFVDAEVTVFPKGHGAIATSWSLPTSECPVGGCFKGFRGPVCYQLELDEKH